ncbi:MAG: 6-phosphogluconolactonase [Treponema sp.]|jgi:galactosamine-6-phosphate isomerase|nr:6-phosphogluconolactonase [Treponema sp.]
MNIRMFEDYAALCGRITGEIIAALGENPALLFCIAAGHSSLGVFDGLARACREKKADFSRAAFVAMDEWAGMSEHSPGSCGMLLRENLLRHLNLLPENIRLFNGLTPDAAAECAEVECFIADHSVRGGIDYLVLGAGINGHLALNEPGTPIAARAHVAKLDPVTREVGQKYFSVKTELNGGLTLGLANFSEARRTVLMVCGEHKRPVLQKILTGPPEASFPATWVKIFDNSSLYYDRAALPQD